MFYGYDTGHDNSGRLEGMLFKGNAGDHIPTPEEKEKDVAPIIAIDMNCNFYATEVTLADMARELGLPEDEKNWREKAKDVKKRLFEVCFDKDDCFFYDADKNGNRRKYLSSTIFHLFLEKVLDPEEDAALIREIYERHMSNPDEFNTPFPYPSMGCVRPERERTRGAQLLGLLLSGAHRAEMHEMDGLLRIQRGFRQALREVAYRVDELLWQSEPRSGA